MKHSKFKIISTSTKHMIIKHNTNSHKSKLKTYQFNNKTHKIKRQCNCFTLIFWYVSVSSTRCSGWEVVNRSLGQWFGTRKTVKRLIKTREDDFGILVENWKLFGRLETSFVLSFLRFFFFFIGVATMMKREGLYTYHNHGSKITIVISNHHLKSRLC